MRAALSSGSVIGRSPKRSCSAAEGAATLGALGVTLAPADPVGLPGAPGPARLGAQFRPQIAWTSRYAPTSHAEFCPRTQTERRWRPSFVWLVTRLERASPGGARSNLGNRLPRSRPVASQIADHI